jgi:hypothetical protein
MLLIAGCGIGKTRGASSWTPLVSMLLIGGCGYEDKPRFLSAVPVEHRLRARLRTAGKGEPDRNSYNWPPYDIARIGEDAYRIIMAVAGFSQDELAVSHVVSGTKSAEGGGATISTAESPVAPSNAASSLPTMSG